MKLKKYPRTVVHIIHDANRDLWVATAEGRVIDANRVQHQVREEVAHKLRRLSLRGFHGQIVMHTKDGRISREFTYGADPKKSKG